VTSNATIPVALCVSLALHGGALAMMDRMPRGWQLAETGPARFGAGVLQARLRAEPSEPLMSASKPVARAVPALAAAKPLPLPRPAFGAVAPPVYLPANELDEKPLIRTRVEPQFPEGAPVSEGRVVLRLYIAETGSIDEIAVVSAEPRQVFEESARRAFAGASFTPGRKNGEPVKSALTIELLFGAPVPVAQTKLPEGPQWQLPRRAPTPQLRREMP
jgi:TonB family protein